MKVETQIKSVSMIIGIILLLIIGYAVIRNKSTNCDDPGVICDTPPYLPMDNNLTGSILNWGKI